MRFHISKLECKTQCMSDYWLLSVLQYFTALMILSDEPLHVEYSSASRNKYFIYEDLIAQASA